MKNYLTRTFAMFLALASAVTFAVAQNNTISAAAGDRYIITAKAGGVNYVEGTVAVVRKSGTSGLLLKGDTLDVGDRVSTSENGKVEILLNPGSFLRLGGNSAFEFNTTSLDDLELRLDKGSAILEVYADDEFQVKIKTPSAMYSLIKSGIFRIDVPSDQASTLKVWKGAATAADNVVKAGRTATASGDDDVAVAKFDRDVKDSLDAWSKSRSKGLAQQSASLRRNDVRTPLMCGFLNGGWNFYNSFGLWIFSPFANNYSFMPFGYAWSSPYGYSYGNGMSWWYQMHLPTFLPPIGGGGPSTGTSTGTGTGTGTSSEARTVAGARGQRVQPAAASDNYERPHVPPFIRLEQTNGGGFRGGMGRDDASGSGGAYSPTYSSPSSSAPPPSSSSSGGGPTSPGKSGATLRP